MALLTPEGSDFCLGGGGFGRAARDGTAGRAPDTTLLWDVSKLTAAQT